MSLIDILRALNILNRVNPGCIFLQVSLFLNAVKAFRSMPPRHWGQCCQGIEVNATKTLRSMLTWHWSQSLQGTKANLKLMFDNNWEHQFRNQIYTIAYCNLTIVVLFIVYVACTKIWHVISQVWINAWCIEYKNESVNTKLLSQPYNKTTKTVVGLTLSNCWEPPPPTHHTNSKLHDKAEIEQCSEIKGNYSL